MADGLTATAGEIIQGPFGLCISRSWHGEEKLDNIAYQSPRGKIGCKKILELRVWRDPH